MSATTESEVVSASPAPEQASPRMSVPQDHDSDPIETQEWIEEALEELPIEQRMCLELAYVLGHSCEEISVITSCPVNTVKTRLYHARRKLSTLLPRLAGNPPNTPQTKNQGP